MDLDQVDPGLFRRVMGRFATGVAVITTVVEGDIHGMTRKCLHVRLLVTAALRRIDLGRRRACTRTCTLPATTVSRS